MHVQADTMGLVVRLYDLAADGPNELNLVPMHDGRVSVGLEDRDGGETHLEVIVTRAELVAALALMEAPLVSVDAPDGGHWRPGAAPAPRDAEAPPPCPACGSTEPDCREGCAVRLETRAKDEARRGSFSVELVVCSDDRPDALEARIAAALDVEGLDFDPMTVSVERIGEAS